MKKLVIALVALLIIVGGAAIFLASNLDGYIKETIEKEGSLALGNPVSLTAVETDLTGGSAKLSGLSIANPQGYPSANAFSVNTIQAKVDYGNQTIQEVLIENPVINADVIGTRSNFQDLLDQMPDSTEEEQATEESEEEPIIAIQSFKLLQATVNLSHDKYGAQSFVMDDLILTDISGTATEISEEIARNLSAHVSKQTTNHIKAQVAEKLKEEAQDAINKKVNEKLKGLKLKFGSN